MPALVSISGYSSWTHRWALVLACATFPLLWVGGLVTTTDAGMAVPDWPRTYGYNLFLYPWRTWLYGPWDLFIEHGHRLLAASVGMLMIGLLVLILRTEKRRWMKGLGFAALALVILQGVLGGMRVLLDERTLAMLHGCTGPAFFAVTVAMTVFTSRTWLNATELNATDSSPTGSAGVIRRLTPVVAMLAYLQIVLGAVVRHVPVDAQPDTFMLAVRFHLFLAVVLSLHIVGVAWIIQTGARHIRPLRILSLCLMCLVIVQIVLGASTWIVKFAVPTWAGNWISPQSVAVLQGGWTQTHIITAHVAIGSLILGTAVALALYSQRLLVEGPLRLVVRRELGAAT